MRILLISDMHLSTADRLGYTQEERLAFMLDCLNAENEAHPLEAILLLGDMSIDDDGFRNLPINYCERFKNEYIARFPAPTYVLPGNHDSYPDDVWQAVFDVPRRYSLALGGAAIINPAMEAEHVSARAGGAQKAGTFVHRNTGHAEGMHGAIINPAMEAEHVSARAGGAQKAGTFVHRNTGHAEGMHGAIINPAMETEHVSARAEGAQKAGNFVHGAIIMADTFYGRASDASGAPYTPVDMRWLRAECEKYEGGPIFLCAHYFDEKKESAEFREFVRENSRIRALFQGHTHRAEMRALDASFGGKPLIDIGGFSYYTQPTGGVWDFDVFQEDYAWGYQLLDIVGDSYDTWHVAPPVFYRGSNVTRDYPGAVTDKFPL